jgi:hypothetical protein
MSSFISASMDRQQGCFNMRNQPIRHEWLSHDPSIQGLRIGPTNLTKDMIQTLPETLEHLDWDMGNGTNVNEEDLLELFQRPKLTHLALRFRDRRVISVLKQALPAAKYLKGLDLRSNLIKDEGVADLVDSLMQIRLTFLNLAFNYLSDEGARNLAKLISRPDSSLEHLDLNCNLLGSSGGRVLAESLRGNNVLKSLVLYGNTNVLCGNELLTSLQFYNDSLTECNLQRTQVSKTQLDLVNYWLTINKCGRKILRSHPSLHAGVWPAFFEKHVAHEPNGLFYFLSQKPELVLPSSKTE